MKMGMNIDEIPPRVHRTYKIRHPVHPGKELLKETQRTVVGKTRRIAKQRTLPHKQPSEALGHRKDNHAVGNVVRQDIFKYMLHPQGPSFCFA